MAGNVRVIALPAQGSHFVLPSYVTDEFVAVEYDLERQAYVFIVRPDFLLDGSAPKRLSKDLNAFMHAITTNTDRPSRKLRALAKFLEMLEEGELFNAEHDEDTAA